MAAHAMLEQVRPHLNFEQGDVTMFVMDVPPNVPLQYAPVVIAETLQLKDQAKTDRTIGVCALVENPIEVLPDGMYSAANNIGPEGAVGTYLSEFEKLSIDINSAKVTVLKGPEHGALVMDEKSGRNYIPEPDFLGPDRATFLVETGGMKIKVEFFIRVVKVVDERLYEDSQYCPNGYVWKISLNPDDPNAPVYTFEHPYQLTNPLMGAIQNNLTIADLPFGALGNTTGTTVTLDDNAAGYG